MKSALRTFAQLSLFLALGLGGADFAARAQSAEQYIISAKAGGVNLISGSVSVRRKGAAEWQPLTPKAAPAEASAKKGRDDLSRERASLNSGDAVRTEETGRVEVLLNPGSYLRLAENSEAEMIDTQLDSLRVKLNKGSAIVEITGSSDVKIHTEIVTPQTTIALVRTGLYRFNVTPSTGTELFVRKGRAVVGTGELITLKDGKKTIVAGGIPQVVKFDKKNQDSFDFWSKSRAETLIAANSRLSDQNLSSAIFNSGFRPLRTGAGLWVYDPFFRSHTFFPYYTGWRSPYGSGYHSSFGYSSDWYRPAPPYTGVNPPPAAGNPNIANPPDGRSIRDRKNQIREELPIRPPDGDMRHHRGGQMDQMPRERPAQNFPSQRSEDSYRPSAPSPRSEPPSYNPPPSSSPGRTKDTEGRGIGPRKMEPL